jgi:hypothetical protein
MLELHPAASIKRPDGSLSVAQQMNLQQHPTTPTTTTRSAAFTCNALLRAAMTSLHTCQILLNATRD